MNPVLRLTGVSKRYGALTVTDDISFAIERGETYGILGPNGAGKTTLFNLVSGDAKPDRGSVEFDGADVCALPPHRRCAAGIGRSDQFLQEDRGGAARRGDGRSGGDAGLSGTGGVTLDRTRQCCGQRDSPHAMATSRRPTGSA